MARLIRLTAKSGANFYFNTDKIISVVKEESAPFTVIFHDASNSDVGGWSEVQETPEQIARMVNEPTEVSLGSEVPIAITEWPRGRLAINS